MRLWSLHPRTIDRVGLVALWREGLLARKVLSGGTKGYTNHPQLQRFKACEDPVASIDAFLHAVQREATARGYRFDVTKLDTEVPVASIAVTSGQLAYEAEHLTQKVELRAPDWVVHVTPEPHPVFHVVQGGVEPWERVQ